MGSIVQKLIIAATIGAALAYDRPPETHPSDITSINNLLKDKNGIETIILRVIKKISDKGALPHDFPHQDYLRLLSAHRAISEDLGSVELSAEQTKVNEFREGEDGEFGKKLTDSEKNIANEKEAQSRSSDYEKYYISPNEPATSELDNVEPQNDEPEKSEPEKSEPEKIDDTPSNTDVESTTKTGEGQSETIPPPNGNEESKESQTEEPPVTVQPISTIQPETQTYPSAEVQQDNDFGGYRYQPVQNIQDSEKSDSTVITQYPSSANENYITREGRKTESNYYQVETPERTELGEESVILQKSEEDQPESNVLSVQSNNEERIKPFSVQYDFVPSAVDSKLVPTKPTPGSDIVVMGPTPIDIPDAQYQDENTTPLLSLSFRRNISKTVEKEREEKKNKFENVRHTVEFAASPLVAAFTVQQDDKGIPRNIVPLDYAHSTAPPAPTEDPEIVARRQRELEEKEFILYQQLKSLQQEKSRYISPSQQRQIMLQKKQEEMKRQQTHYNNLNYYYHHSYQRRPEPVQSEQLRQQVYQGPSEYLRYQEFPRQMLNLNRNNFQPSQGFEFHKSVDYSVPQYEHNRVHRREPTNQIGNFGYNNYPSTVSGQIQSLLSSSGIGYGLPRNTQADLSVVTKILALNHGGFEPTSNVAYRQNQNSIPYK
ncbi:unnamed protein product [Nezara viridula]|uniref:Neuropeptide n=1 Tax=Nezara viridula TaxID=85310 RepID=A0A9P0HKM5_NEZVI|nr:unnamed protein product [Nezara viridula]